VENLRTLTLLLVVALVSCAGSQQPVNEPWTIDVTSSGGFAGKGAGAMHIDSKGAFTVTTMSGKRCPDRLSDEERQRLDKAIANARPDEWRGTETPCCDRIEWKLVLEIGGKKHEITWIDDPKFAMPDDLRALTNVLGDIESKHAAQCK